MVLDTRQTLVCGDYDSVIGMDKEKFLKQISKKRLGQTFSSSWEGTLSGVIVDCDINTGLAKNINSYIFGDKLKNI